MNRISSDENPIETYGRAFGIMNPYGQLWTHNTFPSEAAALQHVHDFWQGVKGVRPSPASQFKIVPVEVTVRVVRRALEQDGGAE